MHVLEAGVDRRQVEELIKENQGEGWKEGGKEMPALPAVPRSHSAANSSPLPQQAASRGRTGGGRENVESCSSKRRASISNLELLARPEERRPATRSLAVLKERVSRLAAAGGGGGGTGLGDGYQPSLRETTSSIKAQAPRGGGGNNSPSFLLLSPTLQAKKTAVINQRSLRRGGGTGTTTPQENEEASNVKRARGAYNWVKDVEGMRRQERLAAAELETPKASAAAAAGRGGILTRSRLAQTARGPARTYSLAAEAAAAAAALPTPRAMIALSGGGRKFAEELETVREDAIGGGVGTRIMVYVRLRPMSKKEKESGSRSCVRVVNKRDVYLTEFALETDYLRLKRLRGRHFAFDAAFPDNTAQQEVYNISTAELVEGVLQGKNGSVFCYGATGAGKTHTMLGTVQNPGVMVLALKDLFAKIKKHSRDGDHVVRLSYLEVYNESVRDLLSPGRPLVLREDSKQGIVAAGLTQYQAYTADEVMTLLQRGNLNRTTEPTRINETSSRSHAILQVVAEYKVPQETGMVVRAGKLSLIDLAGSERALATDQRTLRSVEGASINRSLLALSSCINALCEGKKHIPFRNSKLTQLLKDSLGGSCRTAMIANISPSNFSFGETQNTLHWADRAKEIRTKVCETQEELSVPDSMEDKTKLLHQMQKENQELRIQLARLQHKFVTAQQTAAASPSVITLGSERTPGSSAPLANPTMKTPGLHSSLSEQEFPERVTAERTIRDLQRTIQLLEMEAERAKQDSQSREEKLSASMAALEKAHILELKHKDELIHKLYQRSSPLIVASSPAKPVVAASPAKVVHGCKNSNRKRSFWDITNMNSPPAAPVTRASRRLSTAAANYAPSLLLQPGFSRRQSQG
ncbi:unnamed protein product [Sphagnum troendelagicum]|uniref:Kinesin-like protein n=1 Tax=Sphagnum troendelagicum TaxID=128251 RepID=A0ABP0UJR3_9BRYO